MSPGGQIDLSYSHLVLRQCPGLVRANVGDTPKSLNSRQSADNRVDCDHPLHTDGKHYSDYSRQSLRYGSHCQANRCHEHVEYRLAAHPAQYKYQTANAQRPKAQELSEFRQLLLERSIFLDLG